MRIGFIGLGIMGSPMAVNLVAAGYEVVGFTRTKATAAPLIAAGGRLADDIASVVADADVVVTMLPDSPDVELVLAGEGGAFAKARAGTLFIDLSTIQPEVAIALSESAAQRGLRMLDAPVSGGERGAIEGTLSIMVGGAPDDLAFAAPLLEVMGDTIVHVGPAGSGQLVKAANQLLVAGIIELVSEAMVFLDAHQVDLEAAIEVLNGGLAGNAVLSRKGASMLKGDFQPGFRVELHHKDLGIYREAARAAGVFSPLGAQLAELMSALRATGSAGLDHTALLRQVDRLSGRSRWGA